MNLKLVGANAVLMIGIVAFAELPSSRTQSSSGSQSTSTRSGSSRVSTGPVLEMTSRSFGGDRVMPDADAGGYGGCPQVLSSTPGSGLIAGVDVVGTIAYQAAWSSGLRVVSLDEPSSPSEIGAFDTPGFSRSVTVDGMFAYVADSDSGLRIIDVSDPAAPSEEGHFDTDGVTNWVAVERDGPSTYAYLADGPNGLLVLDVSSPASISAIGSQPTLDSANGVVLANDLAFVADLSGGLRIIDVTNPYAPTEEGVIETWPYDTNAVAVRGDFAFLAVGDEGDGGLIVVDASTPSVPAVVSSFVGLDEALGIAVSDDGYVFLSDEEKLWMIDVSVPVAPYVVGVHDWPNLAEGDLAGVDVEDDLVVEAAGRAERMIVYDRVSCPFFSDGVESGDTSDW